MSEIPNLLSASCSDVASMSCHSNWSLFLDKNSKKVTNWSDNARSRHPNTKPTTDSESVMHFKRYRMCCYDSGCVVMEIHCFEFDLSSGKKGGKWPTGVIGRSLRTLMRNARHVHMLWQICDGIGFFWLKMDAWLWRTIVLKNRDLTKKNRKNPKKFKSKKKKVCHFQTDGSP